MIDFEIKTVDHLTKAESNLADHLLNELIDNCHELEEFSEVSVYGLDVRNKKVVISIEYDNPGDEEEETIFCHF